MSATDPADYAPQTSLDGDPDTVNELARTFRAADARVGRRPGLLAFRRQIESYVDADEAPVWYAVVDSPLARAA
jgi:hypothetical protein